jgi:hypothetical protein
MEKVYGLSEHGSVIKGSAGNVTAAVPICGSSGEMLTAVPIWGIEAAEMLETRVPIAIMRETDNCILVK